MNDLERKLRYILEDFANSRQIDYETHVSSELSYTVAVDETRQAFIDDGYIKLSLIRGAEIKNEADILKLLLDEDRFISDKYKNHLTGQEWYDRFIDEWERTKKRWLDDRDRQGVVDAAKRASDIIQE